MKSKLGKRSSDERMKLGDAAKEGNESPVKKQTTARASSSNNSSKGSFRSDDSGDNIDDSATSKNNPANTMSKVTATQIIDLLIPPKKPKKQTQFTRFKKKLSKDANKTITRNGIDTDTLKKNIPTRTVAEKAWNQVKNMPITASHIENVTFDIKSLGYLLSLKKRIVIEEESEFKAYKAEKIAFCEAFNDAAIAYLYWKTKECTIENAKTLKCAIRKMERIASGIGFLPGYYKAMHTARTKLESINNEIAIQDIVDKFRTATEEKLYEMARDYHDAKWQREQLKRMKHKEVIQKKKG